MFTAFTRGVDEHEGAVLALNYFGGAVAQLGARLDGIEEVVGSNPIGSTNASQLNHASLRMWTIGREAPLASGMLTVSTR
jgi:hypothetical protein